MDNNLTRRSFLKAGAGLAAAGIALPPAAAPLTAGEVIERIKAKVGVPWFTPSVDNLIAGTAEMPVAGIATTMMATLDVVERAAAAGKNMVITHESTFFSHQDATADLLRDPVYQFKLDYLRRHNLIVFHFHDHWHARKPDGILTGMAQALGWEKNADSADPHLYHFSGEPLARFARGIQSRLDIRTLRVVGDPKLPVRNVITSWGYMSQMPGIHLLAGPGVDVLVGGETREWELVEYVQDAITSGEKKALVLLGHVVSEQSGMKYCAEWLKSFIPEVPVEFVAASEPFWSPEHPAALREREGVLRGSSLPAAGPR